MKCSSPPRFWHSEQLQSRTSPISPSKLYATLPQWQPPVCVVMRGPLRSRLSVAAHDIFEGGELFGADRSARMHLAGADANLGAHAELAAIGELGGGVPQHNGAVDTVHEGL